MSSTFETDLRAGLHQLAAIIPSEATERLIQIDYNPRAPEHHRRGWSIATAAGVALAGCLAAVILLLTSSTGPLEVPMAYAGWSALPAKPTAGALGAALDACNRNLGLSDDRYTPHFAGQPVLTDARGKYVAAIYARFPSTYVCISDGKLTATLTGGFNTLSFYAAPGPNQLGLPTGLGGHAPGFPGSNPHQQLPPRLRAAMQADPQFKHNPALLAKVEAARQQGLDQGVESNLSGLAGKSIASVTLVFGTATVDATVENGWYFAWWPNIDYPTSVQVTTRSGSTITSKMNCKSASRSCVFAGTRSASTPGRNDPGTDTVSATEGMQAEGYLAETAGPKGKTLMILTNGQVQTLPTSLVSHLNAARKSEGRPAIPSVNAARAQTLEKQASGH